MATTPPHADHVDHWAHLVTDPNQPEEQRNSAWEQLIPVIQDIAGTMARVQGCDELNEAAVSLIWERLARPRSLTATYDPERGSFGSWCRVVLYHHAIDLLRQRHIHPRPAPAGNPHAWEDGLAVCWPEDVAADTADLLVEKSRRLRTALDHLACRARNPTSKVDYHAVLLVQLRLATAKLLKEAALVDLLERFLPWSAEESYRSFKSGWPSLRTIWDALREPLSQEPYWLPVSQFCHVVNQLPLAGIVLSEGTWAQWVKRAKAHAQRHVESRIWEECFARLLPERPVWGH